MRHRLAVCAIALTIGLAAAIAYAQNRPALGGDEQAIRKATDAYVAAFNKGDVDGMLSIWADRGEYIDDSGKSIAGRPALAAMYKKTLQDNKGVKGKVVISAIRILKDDVAMQDGSTTLTYTGGETDVTPFTALWTKKDGVWQLNLVRELAGAAAVDTAATTARLKDLAWLVGDWVAEDKDMKTTISARWLKGQKFLALDFSVTKKAEEVLTLTQIIGWDPTGQQVHSWVFDSRGGFGEGAWTKDSSSWNVAVAGVTADGRQGTGKMVLTYVDDDNFIHEAVDRSVDGQPLPDRKTKYQRVKLAK